MIIPGIWGRFPVRCLSRIDHPMFEETRDDWPLCGIPGSLTGDFAPELWPVGLDVVTVVDVVLLVTVRSRLLSTCVSMQCCSVALNAALLLVYERLLWNLRFVALFRRVIGSLYILKLVSQHNIRGTWGNALP